MIIWLTSEHLDRLVEPAGGMGVGAVADNVQAVFSVEVVSVVAYIAKRGLIDDK